LPVWVISIGVVCYLSLRPEVTFPVDFWSADKLYHLLAYIWLALLPTVGFPHRRTAVLASISMLILGIVLELGQCRLPGRTASVLDAATNGFGVLVGAALGGSWRRRHGLKEPVALPQGR
jgi:VanZ family protein